uniref:hypothetical protein n=1 Tax=Arthrobacter sp. 68b TaxID=311808 RepID=UPI0015667355|nr:hypothetical protein [Arthrobacter sp. 68b]
MSTVRPSNILAARIQKRLLIELRKEVPKWVEELAALPVEGLDQSYGGDGNSVTWESNHQGTFFDELVLPAPHVTLILLPGQGEVSARATLESVALQTRPADSVVGVSSGPQDNSNSILRAALDEQCVTVEPSVYSG